MSFLSYRGIEMREIRTRFISRDFVKSPDRMDSMLIRWTLDLDLSFNPGTTSYEFTANQALNTAPPRTTGRSPRETEQAIQAYLNQDRGKLIYRAGGGLAGGPQVPTSSFPLIDVGGADCDAQGGPFVESCTVKSVDGIKTFWINLRIVTYTSPCDYYAANVGRLASRAILSNRWTQQHSVDEDYLTTITTHGIAVFRNDLLRILQASPDQFRRNIVLKVPQNFKRDSIEVQVNSEANMVYWTTVDREKHFNWKKDAEITRVEAYRSGGWSRDGIGEAILGSIPGAIQGGLSNGEVGAVAGGARALSRIVPQYFDKVFVRACVFRGFAIGTAKLLYSGSKSQLTQHKGDVICPSC